MLVYNIFEVAICDLKYEKYINETILPESLPEIALVSGMQTDVCL